MASRRPFRGSIAAFLVTLSLAGCSGSSGTDTPDGVGRISLATGSATMVADGKSRTRIDVEVLDFDGKRRAGVEVRLQASEGNLLRFQEERALLGESASEGKVSTNEAGVALAYLESPTTVGRARLTAVAEGADAAGSVQFVAGSTKSVIVNPSLPNLTADGVSSTTVAVWALDEHGNPVDTRAVVEQPAVGFADKPVVELQGGVGEFTYIAGTTVGEVPLRVETEDGARGESNITLIGAVVGAVSVTSSRGELVANGAGTSDGMALLTCTVVGPAGQPLEGVRPTVVTELGRLSLDPADPAGAGPSVDAPPTDALGITQAWLLSSSSLGTAAVWAVAGGQASPVLEVPFVGGSPQTLVIETSPSSAAADGVSHVTLTVAVYDEWGNPTDTRITLGWPTQGRVDKITATTSSGMATFTYTAGTTAGDVALRLTASNGVSAEAIVHLL